MQVPIFINIAFKNQITGTFYNALKNHCLSKDLLFQNGRFFLAKNRPFRFQESIPWQALKLVQRTELQHPLMRRSTMLYPKSIIRLPPFDVSNLS